MESFLREGVGGIASSNLGDSHFFEDTDPPVVIKSYLSSTKENEKLKGMKHLLALLSQGGDISEYFPDVVKNVCAGSVEVKKLVYIYLVHHADFNTTCRELALLSVNSFQKDLAGGNQLIRGLALRVMSSIRLPDLIQIQIMAIRKCSTDISPYVRKCACIALTKAYSLDHSQLSELEEILSTLLDDASTMVLGSAISAFNEICPMNFKLIHPCYRKLCHLLPDMDEWTQAPLLGLMTRYVRIYFTDPSGGRASRAPTTSSSSPGKGTSSASPRSSRPKVVKRRVVKPSFYSDDEDDKSDEEEEVAVEEVNSSYLDSRRKQEMGSVFTGTDADAELGGNLDPDHALLLKISLSLLKSRNACVVLAVCTLHHYCGPQTTTTSNQIGKALIRILKNSRETQFVVLSSIKSFAEENPFMFIPYLSDFFVRLSDPLFNRLLKLEIIALLATTGNAEKILKEMQTYIRHHNTTFVCATIRAVGRVADAAPACAGNCMEGLMHLLYCTSKDRVIDEAVVTLRQLLQQNNADPSADITKANTNIIHRLVKMLITDDSDEEETRTHVLKMPVARASVVWLVSESYHSLQHISPDILRILASKFADEATQTKTQIANFAVKLGARLPRDEAVQSLMTYVLEMARYDVDIDLRDRSRFMTAMMGLTTLTGSEDGAAGTGEGGKQRIDSANLTELASHAASVLLARKLPPVTLRQFTVLDDESDFEIGSLSAIVGHSADGYVPIPNWSTIQLEPNARDDSDVTHESTKTTSAKVLRDNKGKDETENFYGESEMNKSGASRKVKGTAVRDRGRSLSNSDSSDVESTSSSDSSDEASNSDSDSASDSDEDGDSSRDEVSASTSSDDDDMLMVTTIKTKKATTVAPAPALASVRRMEKASPPPSSSSSFIGAPQTTSLLDTSHDTNLLGFSPPTSSFTASTGLSDLNFLEDGGSKSYIQPPSPSAQVSPKSDSAILLQMFESFPATATRRGGDRMNTSQPYSTDAKNQRDSTASPGDAMTAMKLSPGQREVASVPKFLLRPALSSGLQATFRFRHGATSTSIPGASCAYLELKNCNSEGSLRRIRPKFQSDVTMAPLASVPQLAAGQCIDLPVEIMLLGREGKPLRIDFSSDRGNFPGEVTFEKWELLMPLRISVQDFDNLKKKLGGFNENCCNFVRKNSDDDLSAAVLVQSVLERVNVFVVDETEVVTDDGDFLSEYRFAGCYRKDRIEDKLLIFLSSSDCGKMQIVVNGEDAVMSATLADHLKKSLSVLY